MSYHERYGLIFNPFIKDVKDIFVQTPDDREVHHRLNYLLQNKGFGVVTSPPGRGKTTTIRHWAKELNTSRYQVVYTPLSTLTVLEFYKQLATLLRLEPANRKSDNFKLIQAEIRRFAIEKQITIVTVIDEASYISSGILNDLKMLFNFEMDAKDHAVVLLVGLPTLNNTLRLAANEPLRGRITMNYHLEPLNKIEGRNYIQGRLNAAKATQSVFEESAFEAILNAAGGIPRIINKVCNACLLIADSQKAPIVTDDIVMGAVNEVEF